MIQPVTKLHAGAHSPASMQSVLTAPNDDVVIPEADNPEWRIRQALIVAGKVSVRILDHVQSLSPYNHFTIIQ